MSAVTDTNHDLTFVIRTHFKRDCIQRDRVRFSADCQNDVDSCFVTRNDILAAANFWSLQRNSFFGVFENFNLVFSIFCLPSCFTSVLGNFCLLFAQLLENKIQTIFRLSLEAYVVDSRVGQGSFEGNSF
jgi:hypothetical protein